MSSFPKWLEKKHVFDGGKFILLIIGIFLAVMITYYFPVISVFSIVLLLVILFFLLKKKMYLFILGITLLMFLLAQLNTAIALSRWFFLMLLVSISIYLCRKRTITANPVALGLSLFATYALLTSVRSYYPSVSFMKSFSLLILAILLYTIPAAMHNPNNQRPPKRELINIFTILAIIIVISNTLYYFIDPVASFLGGRFRGWFRNPNGIGAVYGIFFVPILMYEVSQKERDITWFSTLIVFLLAVFELLLADSRAGIIACFIGCSIILLGKRRWYQRVLWVSLFIIIVSMMFLVNSENNLLARFLFRNETVFVGSDRLYIWQNLIKSFLENPILGSGFGVADTGQKISGIVFRSSGYTIEKTNSYLGLLQELGVIGVTIFILVLFLPIFRACWKKFKAVSLGNDIDLLIVGIVAAGFFNAMFEAWLFSVGNIIGFSFWIFTSLLFVDNEPQSE